MEIGKEIKLKHKAPVVSMFVVDKDGMPLLGDVMEDKEKGNCHCLVHSGGDRVGGQMVSNWTLDCTICVSLLNRIVCCVLEQTIYSYRL